MLSFDGAPDGSTLKFIYSDSNPAEVVRTEVPVEGFPTSFFEYSRPSGLLRLWRHNAFEPRSLGDFIASGEELDVDDLAIQEVFYVEAVTGWPVAVTITAIVTTPEGQSFSDTVRVLPFDAVAGLAETEIAGFTIFNGSAVAGTNGNDIVIGTDGDDIIVTGNGDDIIVAGAGDDIIDAGFGADVVYAYEGHNEIYLEPDGAAATESGGNGDGNDLVMPGPDGPFTTEQVLLVYRLMYGDDDPWLAIFDDLGGKVQTVKGDGVLFSESDWDLIRSGSDAGTRVIQLEFDLGSPVVAAARMRQELLDIAKTSTAIGGLNNQFAGALIGQAFELAAMQDDFDGVADDYIALRQLAIQNAAAAAELISTLYVSAVAIVSEGADLVFIINDGINGDLGLVDAGLAALPLVPAPVVNITRRAITRSDTGQKFFKRGDTDLHPGSDIRALRSADSGQHGVGLIYRSDFPTVTQSENVNGKYNLLIGMPQSTGGDHAAIVLNLAEERFAEAASDYILMNRSLKTATGRTDLGNAGNLRPDITVVKRDGKVDLYEVQSASDTLQALSDKLRTMQMALPADNRGELFLINIIGEQVPLLP